ncbi:MAG TPA: GDSL-type esterase/lipase family protein [Thermoanaerobaculia bacterium]|nr:GDSL-type esterase/lipase family protein [Thermoanaerobaculia bacterium]
MHPPRILSLGDSYTIGEGIDPGKSWPRQLTGILGARGIELGAPEIVARTGWSTAELAAAIDERELSGGWPLVTLLAGVNDQYRGRTLEEFQPSFAALVERAIRLAGGEARRLLVLSIPDWGATPFARERDRIAIAAAIDDYNAAASAIALGAGAGWVDVTGHSRRAADDATLVAEDGLHLSVTAHRQWAEFLAPLAETILRAEARVT